MLRTSAGWHLGCQLLGRQLWGRKPEKQMAPTKPLPQLLVANSHNHNKLEQKRDTMSWLTNVNNLLTKLDDQVETVVEERGYE